MRRALLRHLLTGAALALLPSAASAQSDSRLATALDRETVTAVERVVDDARSRGLPTEPLVVKALEGAVKGAPGPRIVTAVRGLVDRLATAQGALAPGATPAELVAGADALAEQVPPNVLKQLREAQPDRSVAVALGVLTQLVSKKVPVDQASKHVISLLRRDPDQQSLIALSTNVQADIAAGISPDDALDLRSKGIQSTLPLPRATNTNAENLGGNAARDPRPRNRP